MYASSTSPESFSSQISEFVMYDHTLGYRFFSVSYFISSHQFFDQLPQGWPMSHYTVQTMNRHEVRSNVKNILAFFQEDKFECIQEISSKFLFSSILNILREQRLFLLFYPATNGPTDTLCVWKIWILHCSFKKMYNRLNQKDSVVITTRDAR